MTSHRTGKSAIGKKQVITWIRLGPLLYPVTLAQVRTLLQRQLRMCSQLKKRTLGKKRKPLVKQVLQEERRPKATWDAVNGNGYGLLGAERRA